MNDCKLSIFKTSWGWMGVLGWTAGLRMVVLPCDSSAEVLEQVQLAGYCQTSRDDRFYEDLARKCSAYFEGRRVEFDERLDLRCATPFRRRVWETARAIPFGRTCSYSELAEKAGIRSARAVGQALRVNPFPLVVPCHRVIGKDGKLVGFAGGLAMKEKLLALEACD